LAAVVLLPTPPLPEATATMFLTPAISGTPRCTAWATMFWRMVTLAFSTPGTARAAATSARRSASAVVFEG
jgi:hypothetical protein